MGWSASAVQVHELQLPTILIGGKLELMDPEYRAQFHRAHNRAVARANDADADLYRGGLSLHGSGRVVSLLAGHGGSVAAMDLFGPPEVANMSHGTDMLDPGFVIPRLVKMGFDPDTDPLATYFWSGITF